MAGILTAKPIIPALRRLTREDGEFKEEGVEDGGR